MVLGPESRSPVAPCPHVLSSTKRLPPKTCIIRSIMTTTTVLIMMTVMLLEKMVIIVIIIIFICVSRSQYICLSLCMSVCLSVCRSQFLSHTHARTHARTRNCIWQSYYVVLNMHICPNKNYVFVTLDILFKGRISSTASE